MSYYNSENMSGLLGCYCTDEDAEKFAECLLDDGWELVEIDGQFHAYRDGEEMTEREWHRALKFCFE